MDLSLVVTYHNEGQDFVDEFVKQVKETADMEDYEIIIVDDNSEKDLVFTNPKVRVIKHKERKGVGAGFDTGVVEAQSENIIFCACDIRFIKNGWMSKMYKSIQDNPKSLICTQCVALNLEKEKGLDINHRRNVNMVAGATLLIFHDSQGDRSRKQSYRSILSAKWRARNKNESGEVVIPVILGAFYGAKREWYRHIDGFAGHRYWGTLEPLISIKSWMFGGNCICNKDIETGHIFRTKSVHKTSQGMVYYNKIWTAKVLFEEDTVNELMSYLPRSNAVIKSEGLLDSNLLEEKRDEYALKRVLTDKELFKAMEIQKLPECIKKG